MNRHIFIVTINLNASLLTRILIVNYLTSNLVHTMEAALLATFVWLITYLRYFILKFVSICHVGRVLIC